MAPSILWAATPRRGVLVLLACVLAVAGCTSSGDSGGDLFGAPPADDAGDALPDAAPDSEPVGDAAPDAPGDADADAPATQCHADADCTGSAFGPVCDVPSGRCGQCTTTNDACGAGLVCRGTDLKCVAGCKVDADCGQADGGGAKLTCDPVSHQCIGCTKDDECPAGTLCDTAVRQCKPGCTAAHACAGGQTCCSGQCADTQSDTGNCGACGKACAAADHATVACSAGACVIGTCSGSWQDCNGNYKDGCEADLRFDPQNCGGCFSTCSTNHATVACVDANCQGSCTAGWSDCNSDMRKDGCEVPTDSDPQNCGGCGTTCSSLHVPVPACTSGKCLGACEAGWSDCDGDKQKNGCETSTSGDPQNCGACKAACSTNHVPTPACAGGSCSGACETGWADCDGNELSNGCETNVATNVNACGGCGKVCSSNNVVSAVCAGGQCTSACTPGFTDCNNNKQADGCETFTDGNVASCGGCGVVCSTAHIATPACTNGVCNGACNQGYLDCDNNKQANGCEVAAATDPNNCGGCGTTCSSTNMATRTCSAGVCNGSCASGFADCNGNKQTDGCETATSNDKQNCGGCGVVCSGNHVSNPTCGGGTCNGTCDAGWADCNGNKQTDGCETYIGGTDVANCGGCGVTCSTNNVARACVNGSCSAGTCNQGYSDCNGNKQTDGCEVATGTDLNNCGACGAICSTNHASATCSGGACSQTCSSGYTDCNGSKADGCEAATGTDVNNCGGCGTVCSPNNVTRSCSGGTCNGTCASGFTDCNGNKQTDGCETATGTDPDHCGGCSTVCSSNHVARACSGGSCNAGVCAGGYADCNGNKQTDGCETYVGGSDVGNCGGCGVACSTNNVARVCSAGSCAAGTCSSGFADCNNNKQTDGCEVSINTDVGNCGACGNKCSTNGGTASCSGGSCAITCSANRADCNSNVADGCEASTLTDPDNCGGCGIKCSANNMGTRTCSNGVCNGTCAAGFTDCDGNKLTNGCEVATGTDTNNCGGCGKTCSTNNIGSPTCSGGVCSGTCDSGFADCDGNKQTNGCEINIQSNTSACGGCGKTCSTNNVTGTACTAGQCTGTCNSGYANCDGNLQTNGCEVNTNTDANNCGGCGTVCSSSNMSTRTCGSGVCNGNCATGYGDCDGNKQANGCETNVYTDVNNCGGCGASYVCSSNNISTRVCTTGTCTGSCVSGYADCNANKKTDGCEIQTSVDSSNCGGCGIKCSTNNVVGGACVSSTCTGSCAGGTNNCDSNLQSNGCEVTPATDPNNCGACGIVCSSSHMATRTCTASTCDGTCATNYLDCDSNKLSNGCEVNKLTDVNNCGNCGNVCSGSTPYCSNGTCTAAPVCNTSVLVIGATSTSSMLVTALQNVGLVPTVLTTAPSSYSGSPAATGFGAIFVDMAGAYSSDMPNAGQQSIMNAIAAGSGIGFTDWASYTYPNYTSYYSYSVNGSTLRSYILYSYSTSWSSSSSSAVTWALTSSSYSTSVWSGLSTSFSSYASLAGATGSIINGGTQIASVYTSSTGTDPGVIVKDPGASGARVAFIAHAGDSYSAWASDTNLVRMFANTTKWLARCQ